MDKGFDMSTVTNEGSRLSVYCERYVLPSLFDRLDHAFPEFGWTRTTAGWVGSLDGADRSRANSVSCRHPWGFVTQTGQTQSWLAYANGGVEPVDEALVAAIRKLARLAGLAETGLDREFSPEEKHAATRRERSRQLFEAFAAYAHLSLASPAGAAAVDYLKEQYGFSAADIEELSLGFYTSFRDVVDYLEGVGFNQREILEARAMTDQRLAGRIIVPWRDRWGNIQSIVAHSCLDDLGDQPRRLYLKCGDLSEPFGLNVALRPDSEGCENLILVEDELAALVFHARGVTNVASFGSPGRIPTSQQWQVLADYGVQSVTLAFFDNAGGYERVRATIESALQAERAPRLFCLGHRSLGTTRRPQGYLLQTSPERWEQLVSGRVHAFHFVARTILRTYKRGPWTDEGLMATLLSALKFDADVYTPQRELDLDRFFWRVILDATAAYWPAVRYLLPHRKETLLRNRAGSWSVSRCEEQFRQFEMAMRSGDTQRFTNLIWSAACELAAIDSSYPEPVKPVPRRSRPAPVAAPIQYQPVEMPKKKPQPAPRPSTSTPLPRFTSVDIRRTAYLLWEQNGRPDGRDEFFWFEAEGLLRRLGLLGDEPVQR